MNRLEAKTPTVQWRMAPELRDRLLVDGDLPLADWLRDATATVIKDAPHRAVYRIQLPELDCYVKHYRLLGLRSHLRALFRPTKSRRECETAKAIQARGVPTPEPLAWGTEGNGLGPCASWLVTRTVADTVPLLTYLETTLPKLNAIEHSRIRQELARAIGEFLAQLHAAGVVHADLHPGNLLLRFEPDGRPHLWLIDLHAVSLQPPCPWRVRRENLVVFNRYFAMRASRSDRLRFWHSYRKAAGDAVTEPVAPAACELEQLTHESNLAFWRARDRRSLVSNRYYVCIRQDAVRGHAVRDLETGPLIELLSDPDRHFQHSTSTLLKNSRSSTVVDFAVGGQRVIYKRFRVTERIKPWLRLVRRSAALRSWVFGHGLRERCLPTARPLLVLQRPTGEAYLLTQKIEGAVDLHAFVRRAATLPEPAKTQALHPRIEALARLIRDLHNRGLAHRDLKAANLLTPIAIDNVQFWFIDLVGIRRCHRVGWNRRNQNLARLSASFLKQPLVKRTDRLRFLLTYLHADLHGAGHWKQIWRAIASATQAKFTKNAKNGRPLA